MSRPPPTDRGSLALPPRSHKKQSKLSKNDISIHIYGLCASDGKNIPPQNSRLLRKPFARNTLQNAEFKKNGAQAALSGAKFVK